MRGTRRSGGEAMLLWLSLVAVVGAPLVAAGELDRYMTGLPFAMPQLQMPRFPEKTLPVTDFGAVADGSTLNTWAFAEAIRACAESGGGTVLVPPGTWLTGPIRLESNVNLRVERGALVQFSRRIEDFPLIAGLDGKSRTYMLTPPISAHRARNIAITGEGLFDGAGEVWRYVKKEKLTERQWKELVGSGGVVSEDGTQWWPSREAMEGEKYLAGLQAAGKVPGRNDYARVREFLRPDLVRLVQCDGILIDGPTFRNSPKFHLHLVQSENMVIRNVQILTEWHAQNGDGIDIASCRNVLLYNATVNVGDDGICLKPGTPASSQKAGPACENIVIADCIVYRAHGGFVIGSESYGGARNVAVRNCQFIGTDVGIRMKSSRGRGGLVERVLIEGIQMRAIQNEAILFDMYYGQGDPERAYPAAAAAPASNGRTPEFRDFVIRNVTCTGARRAALLNGLPELPLSGIVLDSVRIQARLGVRSMFAREISLSNSSLSVEKGPVIALQETREVALRDLRYRAGGEVFLSLEGSQTDGILITGVDRSGAKQMIEMGEEVPRHAVTWER